MLTLPPELLPDNVAVQIQSLTRQEDAFLLELASSTRTSPCPVLGGGERLGEAAAPYSRRTQRLNQHLNEIGFALGANGGSKLASFLGMPLSSSTLLRIVYDIETNEEIPTPRY